MKMLEDAVLIAIFSFLFKEEDSHDSNSPFPACGGVWGCITEVYVSPSGTIRRINLITRLIKRF